MKILKFILDLFEKFIPNLFAILLIGGGLFLAASIISFDADDPSFNRASMAEVKNYMGAKGAFIADPLLQIFGIYSLILSIIFIIWGVHARNRDLFDFLPHFLILIITAPFNLAFLSAIYHPESWPFASGIGGIIGDFTAHLISTEINKEIFLISASLLFFFSNIYLLGIGGHYQKIKAVAKNISIPAAKLIKEKIAEDQVWIDEDITEEAPKQKKVVEILKEKEEKSLVPAFFDSIKAHYILPNLSFLKSGKEKKKLSINESELRANADELEQVLEDFGVHGKITQINPGPVVTLYELEPAAGTKSSRVIGLADDIARSISAISARIAVIPGKNAMGIELPNEVREVVLLRELLESADFRNNEIKLPIALGKNISGETIVVDLARMPHLLVAGTTGSGKSVAINTMILSLLFRLTPDQCKFIMIDPKMLELSVYDGIPHLLAPVVTEPGKAVVALKWTVKEMENRYRLMSNLGVRNIAGYNKRIAEAAQKGEKLERTVQTGFDPETGKPIIEKQPFDMNPLPFIVVVVDEMADLMLVAGKDIESSVQRLAQMARAAGIHIIMATQRPSVDVITGVIKANFPTRISFQVTSRIDSRTILGEQGAEQLLGMGDMLYMPGGGKITRVHGAFVDDKEVEEVVSFLKSQAAPSYIEDITAESEESEESSGEAGDNLYDQAVAIVLRDKKASTSYIQRCLKIGYNRAATLMEQMEKAGIISAPNHAGKREVLD